MTYKLQDLIDLEQFQLLQNRLSDVYSFPSAIIDNEGNILTTTEWQDICTKFHSVNKETAKDCRKSDQYLLSHLPEADPAVSYRCPHGLIDNAMPIIIEGVRYGYFYTGQFFLEEPDMDFFREQAKKYGFDGTAYLDAVKKVPVWTQEKLNSYLFFIRELIEIMSAIGLKKLREAETNRQIREQEEQARTVLEQMFDGYWILNMQGRILDVNEPFCRMLGYSRDEMLTMSVGDVVADDPPEVIAQRIQTIVRGGAAYFESRFRRKDGAFIIADVAVRHLPDRDLLIGFHRDITDRKKAEEALRGSQAMLSGILNAVPQSIFWKDLNGAYLGCNETFAEAVGLGSPDRIVGKTDYDLPWPRTEADAYRADDQEVMSRNKPKLHIIEQMQQADGSRLWIDTTKVPLTDATGKPYGVLGVYEDITERKRTEEELKESRQLLETVIETAPT